MIKNVLDLWLFNRIFVYLDCRITTMSNRTSIVNIYPHGLNYQRNNGRRNPGNRWHLVRGGYYLEGKKMRNIKSVLEDKKLTMAAKGVYKVLTEINETDINIDLLTSITPCLKEKKNIRKYLNELADAGYVQKGSGNYFYNKNL